MSFRVDPNAIRSYAAQFTGHADDARAMHDYVARYSSFSWHDQGLINKMQPAHERFATELVKALSHLQDLLTQSRTQLQRVAAFYDHTERTGAARLDDSYPPVPRPSLADTM
ncbi:MAG TPA: type VII secretion target [Micromonosporaceae bacterium]